jgi:peptidoglycan/LPS O-acetylase OafA/YrhL
MPQKIVVTTISVIFAWILLPDSYLKRMGDATMGVSVFVSNIVFWLQTSYFSEAAELQPLMHTWSLAVEEQYYILFPIFLILIWRFGKKSVFWIIITITAISFLISEWGWRNNERANFYLAPTRAWELFAGSISAFIVQNRGIKSNNLIASVGLIAVFYSFLFYTSSTPFPSVYTIVPVVGVILIVLYADSKTMVAKLLSNKTLVGIGLISYSAYLWHQPIFSFVRHSAKQINIEFELRFLLILITFAIAYLSWRYIEKPFRNKSLISQKSIFLISLVSLAGLFLLGLATKEAAKSGHYSLAKILSENNYIYYQNMDDREFIEGRLIYPLKQVNHIVVGSSRVMQINSEMIGEPIFNFAVSGASIEDDIAISLEAVAKVGAKNVFLGIDPWLLNKYDGHTRYKSISGLYEYWIERIKNKMPLQNYLSQNNIHSPINNFILTLRNKLYKSKDLIPKDRNIEAYSKKAYDGEHIYNEQDIINSKKRIIDPKTLDYAMYNFEYDQSSEDNLILLKINLILPRRSS